MKDQKFYGKKKNVFLLALIFAVLLPGCGKDDDSDNEEMEEAQENAGADREDYYYFISGKINGKDFIYGQPIDQTTLIYQEAYNIPLESATCAYSYDQGLDSKINYGTVMYPNFDNEDTLPSLGIDFIRFYSCSDVQESYEVFNDIFSIGAYDFSEDDENEGTMKQVGLNYSPNAISDAYYVSYGGDQSDSTFKITSTTENNDYLLNTLVTQRQIVEGEFSAKVYNINDPSDVLEITEGRFKISVSR